MMHGKYKNIQNYILLDFGTMLLSSFDGSAPSRHLQPCIRRLLS